MGWFVSKTHHEEVVNLLKQQLATERAEKDFYRRTFLSNHGYSFPAIEQSDFSAPDVPQKLLSEVETRKTFRLDREEWTQADGDLFRLNWEPFYQAAGKPPDEIEYWYYRVYGAAPPSVAWQRESLQDPQELAAMT